MKKLTSGEKNLTCAKTDLFTAWEDRINQQFFVKLNFFVRISHDMYIVSL